MRLNYSATERTVRARRINFRILISLARETRRETRSLISAPCKYGRAQLATERGRHNVACACKTTMKGYDNLVKRKRGNKLPGKLQYTSVSIHRRDSHVRGSLSPKGAGNNVPAARKPASKIEKQRGKTSSRRATAATRGDREGSGLLKGTKTREARRKRETDAREAKLSFIRERSLI